MKIEGNSLRIGNVIEHQGKIWRVVKTQHVKPGKGGAYMQVELKDVIHGTKTNERFRSSEMVEKVRLEQRKYQFLYHESGLYTFMNQDDYEQITLNDNDIDEDKAIFLQDGMIVEIETYNDKPIGVSLPEHVRLEVVEADAVVKGQTVSSSYKPAICDNGLRVMVPPYIATGEFIIVSTCDKTFVERDK